jgi:peptidyl-tRNA hydrolase
VEKLPTLYILMRNDMRSMNAGKAMAQASHASNAFIYEADTERTQVVAWVDETPQGFGTAIVLACDEAGMREAVKTAKQFGFTSGIVHDPTYPLRDGDVTHLIPLDTCAYIFGDRNDSTLKEILGDFRLHP